jgi:glucose/arabinose dehydrogenase
VAAGARDAVAARGAARRAWAVVLLLAGLLAAGPLAPRAACAQEPARTDPPAEALPPEPPPAPPAPPRLAPEGTAIAPSSPAAGAPLPAGMAPLPEGGVRIALGAPGGPDPAQARALEALGRALAALPAGRITVEAQVSGPASDVSLARRAALARAQAVKAALMAGGLPATRIDLRPLGRLPGAADWVDVLPPGVASPNAEARGR